MVYPSSLLIPINIYLYADKVDRTVVEYPDLKTPMFAKLNPLLKVPAIVLANGR